MEILPNELLLKIYEKLDSKSKVHFLLTSKKNKIIDPEFNKHLGEFSILEIKNLSKEYPDVIFDDWLENMKYDIEYSLDKKMHYMKNIISLNILDRRFYSFELKNGIAKINNEEIPFIPFLEYNIDRLDKMNNNCYLRDCIYITKFIFNQIKNRILDQYYSKQIINALNSIEIIFLNYLYCSE